MKCQKCSKQATIILNHSPSPLCKNCFLKQIEKRVRKEIRTKKLFSKDDKILIIDDNSPTAAVTKYLVAKITKHFKPKIDIAYELPPKSKQYTNI